MSEFYNFKVKDINKEDYDLSKLKGRSVIVVNTASACGFTPQYDDLQKLYNTHKQNVCVLAFPCNQFGAQESGTNEEIKEFCDLKFKVSFPILDKIDVNGSDAEALFVWLKAQLPGLLGSKDIKWNFTKFVIDPVGKPLKRFAPKDKISSIERFLEEKNLL